MLVIKGNEECLNEMRQSQRSDKDKLRSRAGDYPIWKVAEGLSKVGLVGHCD